MENTDAWSSDTLVSLVVTLIEQLREQFRTSASAKCWRLVSSPLHDTHDTSLFSDSSGNTEAAGVALSSVYPDDSTATPASDPRAAGRSGVTEASTLDPDETPSPILPATDQAVLDGFVELLDATRVDEAG